MKMRILILSFGIILSLCVAELIFFIFNYPSNARQPQYLPGSTIADSVTGWTYKPGTYFYQEPKRDSPTFKFTVLQNGTRATSLAAESGRPVIALFGCSFTAGFGLDDQQTFAWKLQAMLPRFTVMNFAVGAYGSIHSLLKMRQFIEQRKTEDGPAVIVYGFADFHVMRNVKNPQMHRYWLDKGIFPYCDSQSCQTWEGRPMGGLLEHSRVYSLIENLWDSTNAHPQGKEADALTLKLILEMKKLADEHGLKFIVAPVSLEESSWVTSLEQQDISVVECDSKELHLPEFRLSDGHPNTLWNEKFAVCLKEGLKPYFPN